MLQETLQLPDNYNSESEKLSQSSITFVFETAYIRWSYDQMVVKEQENERLGMSSTEVFKDYRDVTIGRPAIASIQIATQSDDDAYLIVCVSTPIQIHQFYFKRDGESEIAHEFHDKLLQWKFNIRS
jgi:hypothetical protein